jgi:hypothetical protein
LNNIARFVPTARRKLLGFQRLCGTANGMVIRGVIADLDSRRKRLWVQRFRITSNNITGFVLTARRKLLRVLRFCAAVNGMGNGKLVADFDPRRKRLWVQRFRITSNQHLQVRSYGQAEAVGGSVALRCGERCFRGRDLGLTLSLAGVVVDLEGWHCERY